MTNKPGRGRPTKYNNKIPARVADYTKVCLKEGTFPTIEGFAAKLKLGTRTLYDWETYRPEFSHAMDKLRDTQRELLISNGLNGGYNTRFTMFLLRANHGMREKETIVEASQNNIMNGVNAELLADALKVLESQDGQ